MSGKNLNTTLLCLLLMLTFGSVKSQFLFSLSYDSLNFPGPSTQSVGGTVRYTFDIHNNSATTFQDSLFINVLADTFAFTLVAYDTVTIGSGGTFTVDTTDTVSLQRYGGGINILVIWPTSPSFITTDSIIDTLIVLMVGVDDPQAAPLPIDVFPVPSQQDLFFRLRDPSVVVTETRIESITGQTLRTYDGLPLQVSLADLPRGVYFIRMKDALGRISNLKVLKQ